MNRNLNIAIILVSTIILTTINAYALTPVSPEELKSVTGQAGITVNPQDIVGIDWTADQIVVFDSDGTDGNPASLKLNNIEYAGQITLDNQVSVVPSYELDPYTKTMKKGINLTMDGADIKIDRYHIDSITIEGVKGSGTRYMNEGKSFGSITVEGFHAKISGKIRISTF